MNFIWRDLFYNKLCASILISNKLRVALYKRGGLLIGNNVDIRAHCFVGNSKLEIGDDTFVNYNVWFNTAAKIKIGSKCNIACQVIFLTSTHKIGTRKRRAEAAVSKGIEVGDGTWIGARAIILPGIKIGKGVVIGAGSVVTKDCEDNCIYAGNPAKMIKRLTTT